MKKLLISCLMLLPMAAQADDLPCASHEEVMNFLADKHGENRRMVATVKDMFLLETFANDETQSFTLVLTDVDGKACILLDGYNYTEVNDRLMGETR